MRRLLTRPFPLQAGALALAAGLTLAVAQATEAAAPRTAAAHSPATPAAAGAPARPAPLATARAEGGFVRGMPPGGRVTAGYFTLHNTGDAPLTLVGARSPLARAIEMHESFVQGGQSRMRPQASVSIPAHGTQRFAPGGLHLMVFGLNVPAGANPRVPITLLFANDARLELSLPVCSVMADRCP